MARRNQTLLWSWGWMRKEEGPEVTRKKTRSLFQQKNRSSHRNTMLLLGTTYRSLITCGAGPGFQKRNALPPVPDRTSVHLPGFGGVRDQVR